MSERAKIQKISIIVPMYNMQDYVLPCLRSALTQTFQEYEVVAVNDGSTDGTLKLAESLSEEYPEKLVLVSQENKGLGGARNTGIQRANGKYVLFLDADDTLEPHALEVLYETCEINNSDIAICDFIEVNETGKEKKRTHENLQVGAVLSLPENKELLRSSVSACNKLMRRSLFLENDIAFPERLWYEDLCTTPKLLLHTASIVYTGNALYRYTQRAGSITKSKNSERNLEIITAMNELIRYYKKQGKYEEYKEEMCFLAIWHVYIAGSVRIVRADKNTDHLLTIQKYMEKTFPNFENNKYIAGLSRQHQLVFSLLRKGRYRSIRLLFKAKGLIS